MMNKIYDLIIIGAGASGLFAASKTRGNCLILEKNDKPCKKIYATGNGRCNFLNAEADFSFYNNQDFVGAVFDEIPVDGLIDAFEELGILAKEEDMGRLYPRSSEAAAIAQALIKGASKAEIRCGFEVKTAEKINDIFVVKSIFGDVVSSRKLLIATGGKAGIQFGSDGRGFKLAESFGHHIIKPVPALAPLLCKEDISSLAGVRCEAMVSLFSKGKRNDVIAFDYFGEVQFTKDAISGICIMDLAREIRLEDGVNYILKIDPLWDYDLAERNNLIKEFPLKNLVPAKLADYMKTPEPLKFTITGTKGWPNAQTTSGGVDVSEINPETMQSKLVSGLYFAGEVIDIDGPCGGFNLTWAFASGYLAGENI